MKIPCLCKCSLKGVDVVEHDTMVRSKSFRDVLGRLPEPAELLDLAGVLAEEVTVACRKVEGFAYYSDAFVAEDAIKALKLYGLGHAATLAAMEDAGLVACVARQEAAGKDLYRFASHVLPGTIKVLVQACRLPRDDVGAATTTCEARVRCGDGPWRSATLQRDPSDFVNASPAFFEFPVPRAVLAREEAAPAVEVEVSWTGDRGAARVAATRLAVTVDEDLHAVDATSLLQEFKGGAKLLRAKARQIGSVPKRKLHVWHERAYLDMLAARASLPLPPWRPLDMDGKRRTLDGFRHRPYLRLVAVAARRRPPTPRLTRVGRRVEDRSRALWDEGTRSWAAHVRLVDVRDARLKTEAVVEVLGGDYVLTVGAKLGDGPRVREVKSAPAPKDWHNHGADFGAATAADRTGAAGSSMTASNAAASRRRDALRLQVYERLRSDLLETYGVGHCTIPLLGLPFVKDPSDLREPASAVRSFPVRRHALFMGERADTDNGVLRAAIWLRSTKRESSRLRSAFRAWPYFAAAAAAALQYYARSFPLSIALLVCAAALEAPRCLGAALTHIVRAAAPGLDIGFERVAPSLSLWRGDDGGSELRVAVDVQGFRLGSGGPGYVSDFVAAEGVRVVLRFPRELLYAAAKLASTKLRSLSPRRGAAAAPDYAVVRLDVALDPPRAAGAVYAKITTTGTAIDAAVTLARTESVASDGAAASFPPTSIPLAMLRRRSYGAGVVDVVVFRANEGRADDYMGIATNVALLAEDGAAANRLRADLRRHGAVVGAASGSAALEAGRGDATLPQILWSPYPSLHKALRERAPNVDATRLCTVAVEDLSVRGGTVAFGMARGEFNVNRFERALAEGKVRRKLPRGAAPPNTLRVTVVRGYALPARSSVVASVRGDAKRTAERESWGAGREAVFEPHEAFEFACPDPSAVLVVEVFDEAAASTKAVARWIVTSKMLVLDPFNVYGRDLKASRDRGAGGGVVYKLRGRMALRNVGAYTGRDGSDVELVLKVDYAAVAGAPTQSELLQKRPLTALAQLQQNSAETGLRLGSLSDVRRMLDDFPLLLDVRAFGVKDVRLHLNELFAGYKGRGDAFGHKFGADALTRLLKKDEPALKKKGNAIYLDELDIKGAAKLGDGASLGDVVAALASPSVLSPVLKHLDLSQSLRHMVNFKRGGPSPDDAADGDDGGGDGDDEPGLLEALRAASPASRVEAFGTFSKRTPKARVLERGLSARLQKTLLRAPDAAGTLLVARGDVDAPPEPAALRLHGDDLFLTRVDVRDATLQSRVGETTALRLEGAAASVAKTCVEVVLRDGALYLFSDDPKVLGTWADAVNAAGGGLRRG